MVWRMNMESDFQVSCSTMQSCSVDYVLENCIRMNQRRFLKKLTPGTCNMESSNGLDIIKGYLAWGVFIVVTLNY